MHLTIELNVTFLRTKYVVWRHNTQHNNTRLNDVQQNDNQVNNIQQNETQLNGIQHDDTQFNDSQDNGTQHEGLICDTQNK